jgi:anti-sigma factor RsiW
MNCDEAAPLLHARLDNELDMAGVTRIDSHLAECRVCAAQYAALQNLHEEIAGLDLSYTPRPAFEQKIVAQATGQKAPRVGFWNRGWFSTPAMAAIAFSAVLAIVAVPILRKDTSGIEAEILDNHLRALQSVHQVDVPSSDQHTVKPWFQGKTSFSPQVPDLGEYGFVLVGGRLEVIHQQTAAAIVYRRGQHVIDLYVSQSAADSPIEASELGGYHLLHWAQDKLSYWAVSDVDPKNLRAFADLIRER